MTDTSDSQAETIVDVFCVYSLQDEALQRTLKKHLDNMDYRGCSLRWHERRLAPGVDWTREIDEHIDSAQLLLLLISIDFIDSHYSQGRELARAFERHKAGTLRIIPILLRAVNWSKQPFMMLQALPANAVPITNHKNQDEAFTAVARGIFQVVNVRKERRARPEQQASMRRSSRIWQVPYALNPLFAEHELLLNNVFTQLLLNKVVAINGPGGSGKSRLTAEYIYRHCQQYRAMLWIDASTSQTLKASYEKLAALFYERPEPSDRPEQHVQLIKAWLSANKDWLLVLDSLDDCSIAFPIVKGTQRGSFLPDVLHGHVLITTRITEQAVLSQALSRQVAFVELSYDEDA